MEVKQEVEMHLKEKDIIEATIPGNIVIGPFWVNTENVRQTLSKKRKNLSNAMLELLARKLRNQADDVSRAQRGSQSHLLPLQEIKIAVQHGL